MSRADALFHSQLAKAKYKSCSDKGTAFFHSLMKTNKRKRFIVVVQRDDESVTSSMKELSQEFLNYF